MPHPTAVILARGLGTRMRAADDALLSAEQTAAADAGLKSLIPLGGRPFLDFVLAELASIGIERVCIIVAPGENPIRDRYARDLVPRRLRIEFAVQPEPRGTADAMLAVEPLLQGEPFLVMNADNLYPATVLAALVRERPSAMPAFSRAGLLADGLIPAERIDRFALLEIDEDGWLRRVVEKPDAETARRLGDARVSMNVWYFTREIFDACRDVAPSARGELELPHAVQLAIDRGLRIRAIPVDASVLDLSRRADIAAVAERLAHVEVRL